MIFRNQKNKNYWYFFFSVFIFFFFSSSLIAQAQVEGQLTNFVTNTPLIKTDLVKLIFNIIRYVLTFLGVVAIVILIYGGFTWLTAAGNTEKVAKAKKILINGLIGLVVVLLSYTIVSWVIGVLSGTGRNGDNQTIDGPGPGGYPPGAKYLVITSRYPQPDAIVARNNKIVITFNQDLELTSVKLARPQNNPSQTNCSDFTVSIKKDNNYLDGSLKVIRNALIFVPKTECPAPLNAPDQVCQAGSSTDCSLELTPDGCCGCFPTGSINITLRGGPTGLKGTRTTGNTMATNRNWSFTVAEMIETSAPSVENNLPQGTNLPRNVGIVATFSKEIDLSTLKVYNPNCKTGSANCNQANCGVQGCLNYAVDDFNKATVKITKDEVPIPGFFERLSTRAFIFRPSSYCPAPAQNCRCLPANSEIKVTLTDGIKDVNCNKLDCANGKCDWQFTTSNSVDLSPPQVSSNNPLDKATNVDRLTNPQATFNEIMDPTSINEDTFAVWPEMLPQEISSSTNPLFTYRPYRVLEANTNYSSIIYGGGLPTGSCQLDPDSVWGVKDLAGNAMVRNHSWSFKTSAQVNAGQPIITRVSPTSGPFGQCVTIGGFNLGCCLENPCPLNQDKPAQANKWTGSVCQPAMNSGQVEFFKEWSGTNPVYLSAEILSWKEIRKPEKCVPPHCPANCSTATCPTTGAGACTECRFCSQAAAACGTCWCLMPANYSPENEIIVSVPAGAANRSPSSPGQIKVTPAH